ncbi:hypothetical protein [Fluviibacter phosphoraccumulans]
MNARRAMSKRRFICASPGYLEKHGRPRSLKELISPYHGSKTVTF